jgi:hypothetical protein
VTRKAYGPYPECEERDQSKMIKTQATGPKQEPETGRSGNDTPRIRRVFAGSASTVVASVLRNAMAIGFTTESSARWMMLRKAYGPYPECEERDQSKMIKTQATGPKQEPETGKSGDDTPRIRRVFGSSAGG